MIRLKQPFPIAFVAILLFSSAANAQRMGPPPPTVEFPAGAQSVEVPMALDGHLVTLPITLEGHELSFVLDTGAGGMALADSKWIETLDLPVIGQGQVGGAGGGERATVDLVGPITFDIAGMEIRREMTAVGLGSLLGNFRWDGVFGAGVLSQTVAEIDYEDSEIRFHQPATFEMPVEAIVLPTMLMSSGIAAVEAQVTIDGGEVTHWFAIDIGAFHSLSLDIEGLGHALPTRRLSKATSVGWGIQGEVRGEVGIIDSLRLGPIQIDNLITTFSTSEGMRGARRLTADTPVIGNLGSGILKGYTVIVDHPGQRLGLVPNREPAPEFLFNTTGIAARPTPTDGRLPIHEVIPGSPAEDAGLREGDVILTVNGRTVTEHGGALRGLLMNPGLGNPLDLVLERADERLEVSLVARRLLE